MLAVNPCRLERGKSIQLPVPAVNGNVSWTSPKSPQRQRLLADRGRWHGFFSRWLDKHGIVQSRHRSKQHRLVRILTWNQPNSITQINPHLNHPTSLGQSVRRVSRTRPTFKSLAASSPTQVLYVQWARSSTRLTRRIKPSIVEIKIAACPSLYKLHAACGLGWRA